MPRRKLPLSRTALRGNRINAGLTIPQLAKLAGVDRGQLWRWENDNATVPLESSLKRVADALGLPMSSFLDDVA